MGAAGKAPKGEVWIFDESALRVAEGGEKLLRNRRNVMEVARTDEEIIVAAAIVVLVVFWHSCKNGVQLYFK